MQSINYEHLPETALTPLTMTQQDMVDCIADIEELGLSDEEAESFLIQLWEIMSTMVTLGFGVHNVQSILGISEAETASETDDSL